LSPKCYKGIVGRESILGAYKATTFSAFLKTRQLPETTVILLDNASIHRSSLVKQVVIEKNWTLLFLPPYSPWFNPIEAFSIVKRQFYQHWNIEDAFKALTAEHCKAFFKHAFQILKEL
jgi:putative transposase